MSIIWGVFLVFILLLPLYLWAYGVSCLQDDAQLIRGRFWGGVLSWVFSVGTVYVITQFWWGTFIEWLMGIGGFFICLFWGVILGSVIWSQVARRYIRAMGVFHIGYMLILVAFIAMGIHFFPKYLSLFIVIMPILLAVFFEESAKHMTVLGYLGKDFRFSLRDFAYFSFFVVVGFVFFENILYFFSGQYPMISLVYRSFFPFATHLLSTLLCTLMWWRALSFPFFSLRYIVWFLSWLIAAIIVHAVYNISLAHGWMIIGIFECIWAYILFIWMTQSPKNTK